MDADLQFHLRNRELGVGDVESTANIAARRSPTEFLMAFHTDPGRGFGSSVIAPATTSPAQRVDWFRIAAIAAAAGCVGVWGILFHVLEGFLGRG